MERFYHVERIDDLAELDALRAEWAELMARAPEAPIFLTPEWVTTWWENRAVDADLWVLAARDDEGRLAGLAPWMLVREHIGPAQVRRLAFLGGGLMYPVHLDIIAPAGEQENAAGAFLRYLRAHSERWDVLDLADLHPDSCLKICLDASGLGYYERAPQAARYSRLPADFETYEKQMMTSSRRGHMRQKRRKLEREHQGVSFELVTDPAQLDGALEALAALNQQRWNERGVASAFDFAHFVAFHRAILPVMLERGWLRFYVLRVGTEVIAAVYGLLYQGVFYAYQAAFDPRWGRYSPGYLLFTHAIRDAIGEGAHEWNMQRGDQEYKLSWTHDVRLDSHLVTGISLVGRLYAAGMNLFDRAKVMVREHVPEETWQQINRFFSPKGQQDGQSSNSKEDVSD